MLRGDSLRRLLPGVSSPSPTVTEGDSNGNQLYLEPAYGYIKSMFCKAPHSLFTHVF